MGPIPAKYFWPGFVVALLTFSVGSAVVTVYASQSDGGAQVVPDYSAKAADWQETLEKRKESKQLGWKVEVRPGERPGSGQTPVELELRGPNGEPITDLSGAVDLRRPSLAGVQATGELESVPSRPGVYRVRLPLNKPGLWDFDVKAEKGQSQFIETVRKEL